ncbi:hypothetical protein GKZ90_0010370 [Flavobacterium sp. MC2016-06]|jgi:hypothetical protein|uniref:hypothetical protein n=1 Tax=Flavobacterium sp. MC2016-06 TaxID=2676308 RepID=UPI0012BB0E46|nr:hypothetical protein [Flavobacterium sp. MC2016-06]MBU3858504.1 hypothetical protein [Flavobacterium sp. MC2016-06]
MYQTKNINSHFAIILKHTSQSLMILLLISLFSCNKNVKNKMILSKDSDTVFWKRRVTEKNNKLIALKDIEESKGENFRFSTPNLIIDINSLKSHSIGKIIFFVQKMDDEQGLKMKQDIFKKEYNLTENQIKKIKLLIAQTKIKNLPSDKFIKGWNTNGNDGETYIFETKNDTLYTYKHYWSPDYQKRILEAQQVENFVNDLFKIIDIKKLETQFITNIPFKNYLMFY